MKKKIFNVVFVILLLLFYFGSDFVYSELGDSFYPDNVIDVYENRVQQVNEVYADYVFDYSITKVLYRDIYDFYDEITIYKGQSDGYEEGMAVIDEYGLVGVINSAENESSHVTLLTNESTSISVQINSSFGILKYDDENLVITNLTSEEFSVGDYIYTSGYSNLYEGILVGVVGEKVDSYELAYYVSALANFSDMRYLLVIKDVK